MKKHIFTALSLAVLLTLALSTPWITSTAQVVADQVILKMKFVKDGITAQGQNVLQTGEVGTLSAAVATTSLTEVVAAPSSGSIYLRGIWIEKATATTGNVLVRNGTGTNCGTGTATILSIGVGSPAIGYYPLNVLVPGANAVCLSTDASTTSARALTN